mgnify:CR=1 FL=1
MAKEWTPKELVLDLVSVQSDTYTKMEIDMARHILEVIKGQDYWKEHPELCGLHDGHDRMGRLVPWAMRRGTSEKCLVLSGHFDCVEIDCYGTLKEFALTPEVLKEKMKDLEWSDPDVVKDLASEDWLFGRGTADMKGGTAVLLCELFKAAAEGIRPDLNILYVGVGDEETAAEGIFQSVGLFTELKDRYDLDYKLLVNGEPTTKDSAKKYVYYDGSIGKALPFIVTKSKLVHVGNLMQGLNSAVIASNIVRRVELNTDLCSEDYGQKCVPPTVLYMKDDKKFYNVSVPLYTNLFLNTFFTNSNNALNILRSLGQICREAADEAVEMYNKAYDFMKPDHPNPNHNVRVMSLSELEDFNKANVSDYDSKKDAFVKGQIEKVNSGQSITQLATGFDIVQWEIEQSEITDPMVVYGLMAPYVPAVNNHYFDNFDREGMINAVADALAPFDITLVEVPYFMGLSDNSYISDVDATDDIEALKSMVTPKEVYTIPLKEAEYIALPSIIIGPWGKDYHTITERVYLPDLQIHTPAVVRKIIETI